MQDRQYRSSCFSRKYKIFHPQDIYNKLHYRPSKSCTMEQPKTRCCKKKKTWPKSRAPSMFSTGSSRFFLKKKSYSSGACGESRPFSIHKLTQLPWWRLFLSCCSKRDLRSSLYQTVSRPSITASTKTWFGEVESASQLPSTTTSSSLIRTGLTCWG